MMAMITLTDSISKAFENGVFAIGPCLDFSKVFVTINYSVLSMKMFHYGICGCALEWFVSYLTNRKQYVVYINICSDLKVIYIYNSRC